MLDSGEHEGRKFTRHPHDARATVSLAGVSLEGWTLDVSRGGARVIVEIAHPERAMPLLDRASLVLSVTGWSARFARVVWHATFTGGVVLGLRFEASGSASTSRSIPAPLGADVALVPASLKGGVLRGRSSAGSLSRGYRGAEPRAYGQSAKMR